LADAREDWLAAIELLRRDNDGEQLGRALRALGELERKLGDGESARAHYEEAVALGRKHGDALRLAHTVRHLGDVYHHAGRADLTEPCYEEALTLYRGHANPPALDLANAIRSMAVLKEEAGERQQARSLWSEARELYVALGVEVGVAESNARLARLVE
jgi:tetratricopeptide (TPR) repeat protein